MFFFDLFCKTRISNEMHYCFTSNTLADKRLFVKPLNNFLLPKKT